MCMYFHAMPRISIISYIHTINVCMVIFPLLHRILPFQLDGMLGWFTSKSKWGWCLNCSECVQGEKERGITSANFIMVNVEGWWFMPIVRAASKVGYTSWGCKNKAQALSRKQKNRTCDRWNEVVCGCLNCFVLSLLNMTAKLLQVTSWLNAPV